MYTSLDIAIVYFRSVKMRTNLRTTRLRYPHVNVRLSCKNISLS